MTLKQSMHFQPFFEEHAAAGGIIRIDDIRSHDIECEIDVPGVRRTPETDRFSGPVATTPGMDSAVFRSMTRSSRSSLPFHILPPFSRNIRTIGSIYIVFRLRSARTSFRSWATRISPSWR